MVSLSLDYNKRMDGPRPTLFVVCYVGPAVAAVVARWSVAVLMRSVVRFEGEGRGKIETSPNPLFFCWW